MIHLHAGPWRETLTAGTWADPTSGELQRGRITRRRRTCEVCGRLDEITTRDGRRWRRSYAPTSWVPPIDPEHLADELRAALDQAAEQSRQVWGL